MALMHEIKEDFILSNKELAEKYYNDLIGNISQQEWRTILSGLNLSKLLEDKLIKHDRLMTTIGRPIQLRLAEENASETSFTADTKSVYISINFIIILIFN